MHSHEHASLNMILLNNRFEHVCLDELCLVRCSLEPFNAYVSALDVIWWRDDRYMLGFMPCHARLMLGWFDMYARWMLGDAMLDVCQVWVVTSHD